MESPAAQQLCRRWRKLSLSLTIQYDVFVNDMSNYWPALYALNLLTGYRRFLPWFTVCSCRWQSFTLNWHYCIRLLASWFDIMQRRLQMRFIVKGTENDRLHFAWRVAAHVWRLCCCKPRRNLNNRFSVILLVSDFRYTLDIIRNNFRTSLFGTRMS